ncbi:MAG: hypothetical protein WD690_07970 [Vicinamibacterales bacterium]
MDLAPDFNEFCGLLNEHRVEFVIVGAYALAFHGHPRFTGDFDILVRPTVENGERLAAAIAAFGFPTSAFTAADVASGRKVIQMGLEPVQIHVMSDISGVSWDEVWSTRAPGTCGDHAVSFIGRAAFVKNKRASGRLQDLADIESLGGGEDPR